MANKKVTNPALDKKKKGRKNLGKVELDKVGLTAAALGTFLIAQEVSAAEDDKQQKQEAGNQTAQQSGAQEQDKELLQQAQAENTAEITAPSEAAEATQAADASAIPGADGDAADIAQAKASDVPVADLDGVQLSAAPDTQLPTGVDAKTTMSDAGAAGGGDAGAAGAASSAGAEAGTAAAEAGTAAAGAGAAAGALGPVVFGSLPMGAIFGAGAAIAAAVGGGGGGGGGVLGGITAGGGGVLQQTVHGMVADANVKGAHVWYDLNDNGKIDAGDADWGLTNDDGSYDAKISGPLSHRIIVTGGVDILTGQTIGTMVTPVGMTGVNPLTTLLAASGQDAQTFLAKLGLSGLDLNNFDPVGDMKDPAKAALTLKAFTISQTVYTVLQTAAQLQASMGGSGGADITNIANSITAALTQADPSVSFADRIKMATAAAVSTAVAGSTNPQAQAMADAAKSALLTTTAQIQQDYVGGNLDNPDLSLATAIANNDKSAIAAKVAAAALGQSALTDAIKSGSTDTLSALSDPNTLQQYANLYKDSISSGTVVETVKYVAIADIPASGKYVITDTAAHIVAANPAVLGAALGVVVNTSPTVAQFDALKGYHVSYSTSTLNVGPTQVQYLADNAALLAQFKIYHIVGTTGGLYLSLGQAQAALNAGATFVADNDHVNTLALTSDDIAQTSATAMGQWYSGGLTQIDGNGPIVLSEASFNALYNAHFHFTAESGVTLKVNDGDLFGALGDKVQHLGQFGVDVVTTVTPGGTLHFAASEAVTLLKQGLVFDDAANVIVSVTGIQDLDALAAAGGSGLDKIVISAGVGQDGHLALLTEGTLDDDLAALHAAGVTDAVINVTGDHAVVDGNDVFTLLHQGLHFSAEDNVTFNVEAGTLDQVLGQADDLVTLGIDSLYLGDTANITLSEFQRIVTSGLHLAQNGEVTVAVTDAAELAALVNNKDYVPSGVAVLINPADGIALQNLLQDPSFVASAAILSAHGGATLNVAAGAATISEQQLLNLHQITFDAGNTVTVTVDNLDALLQPEGLALLQTQGVDLLDLGMFPVRLGAADLATLASKGVGFAHSMVTVEVHDATELLSLPLDQLNALGLHGIVFAPESQAQLGSLLNIPGGLDAVIQQLREEGIGIDAIETTFGAQINLQQAAKLAAAGLSFASPATVLLSQTDVDAAAGETDLLKGLNVSKLLALNPLTLTSSTAATLMDAHLAFTGSTDVTLSVADGDIGTVLSGHLSDLGAFGIHTVVAADGTLNMSAGQYQAILDGGATLSGNDNITVSVSDASGLSLLDSVVDSASSVVDHVVLSPLDQDALTALTGSAKFDDQIHNLQSHNIDVSTIDIGGAGMDVTASISDAVASQLVSDGLHFASGDHIGVQAEGTNLHTSLQDLQKLGIDTVSVAGGTDTLNVTAGGPMDASGIKFGLAGVAGHGIPTFGDVNDDNALNVNLHVDNADLASIISHAGELGAAGIDHLTVDDASGINIDLSQADMLLGGDGQLDSTDISFSAGQDVTLSFDQSQLDKLMGEAGGLHDLGVNHLDVAGDAATLTITEAQAAELIHAGLDFNGGDVVTMGAEGTHLSTSLKDLQKLGVNNVTVSGDSHELHVAAGGALDGGTGLLGTMGGVAHHGIPLFGDTSGDGTISAGEDSALDVTLHVNDADLASIVNHAGELGASGIDHLSVDDTNDIGISLDQADSLLGFDGQLDSIDLSFSAGQNVTLSFNQDELGRLADEAQGLHDLGVTGLDVVGDHASVLLTEAQANQLIHAGLEFNGHDMVTMGAEGTHLSTSLQDLQKLGVNNVTAGDGVSELHLTSSTPLGHGALPTFGDTDGVTGISAQEDAALHVTLDVNAADLNNDLLHATQLSAAGIDTIHIADQSDVNIDLSNVFQMLGTDDHFTSSTLQIDSSNDVTLSLDSSVLGFALQHAADLQGLGVDHLNLTGNPIEIGSNAAQHLIHSGLDFSEGSDVTLVAGHGEGTHLSTSLKDIAKLGVNNVTAAAGEHNLTVNLGQGDFTGHLPSFDSSLNVTLNAGVGQLQELKDHANDLSQAGIDHVQLHGGLTADWNSLTQADLESANVHGFTLDVSEHALSMLTSGDTLPPLPQVGSVHVDKLDVIGGSAPTSEVHVDLHAAQALVDAGITFETTDHITLDVTAGAAGTHFATSAADLHKLGVDEVVYHVSGSIGADLNGLPTFDQDLHVTLDLSELSGEPQIDGNTGMLLHERGIDRIEINESVDNLADALLGSLDVSDDGSLDIIHGQFGLETKMDLQGSSDPGHLSNLDQSMTDLYGALSQYTGAEYHGDLVAALLGSGVTDVVVEHGGVEVSDGLVNALADAGMLHALPDANLVLDATTSGMHMFTSLKEMADLGVDHVKAATGTDNLYVDLGQLGEGNALAEVQSLLAHLDPGLFDGSGAAKPTLVIDNKMAELLSKNGTIDASLIQNLHEIGFKEVDVLVGHNEQSNVVAQTALPVEVKIIGQDTDPTLYDDLHHPKH